MIFFFFFNDTATTEIYTLSLHALFRSAGIHQKTKPMRIMVEKIGKCVSDRKSTRLNSSHHSISYAVFCLKKKKPYIATRTLTFCGALLAGMGYLEFRRT